jgi:capsular polysaccharide biosynthesis protein
VAARGRFDLLIDLERGPGTLARVRALLPRLGRGGRLVVRRPDDGGRTEAGLVGGRRPQVVRRLAGDVETSRGWWVVTSHRDASLKLREGDVARYLAAAGPAGGRVLATVPTEPWTSRGRVTGSDAVRAAGLPSSFAGEALRLRAYDGAVLHRRSAVTHGTVALPDSFRRDAGARPTNRFLTDAGPRDVLTPPTPSRRLDGTHLLLDNEWRGEFGHHLVEQVSKTWAWRHALEVDADARVLVSEFASTRVQEWELALLEASGVPRDRVTVVDEPVVVEHLLTATSAFRLPDRVHPSLLATYRRVGDALAARADPRAPRPQRVFFSRRVTRRRACRNTPEVEALFAEHGFAVVHPEDLSLPEQVATMRHAQVFAGFAGSGVYHLALADRPLRAVLVGSASYRAVVEPCLAALHGHHLDLTWCRPVVPDGERPTQQSDFVFDDVRDGRHLRQVLSRFG